MSDTALGLIQEQMEETVKTCCVPTTGDYRRVWDAAADFVDAKDEAGCASVLKFLLKSSDDRKKRGTARTPECEVACERARVILKGKRVKIWQ